MVGNVAELEALLKLLNEMNVLSYDDGQLKLTLNPTGPAVTEVPYGDQD